MWNLTSFSLEIVLVSVQDRCTVCAKRTIGLDIVFNAPIALLGDEAQLEARFSPCGDRTRPMELLGDVGHVESRFFPFGDSVSVGAR